jgi:hypothetical protein
MYRGPEDVTQYRKTPREPEMFRLLAQGRVDIRSSSPPRSFPMVFVPYLPRSQLRLLQQQVSGIDLSGNALIAVPAGCKGLNGGRPDGPE